MTGAVTDRMLIERGLPASPEAERAVLGAIVVDNAVYHGVISLIRPQDFSVVAHRRIFEAMIQLIDGVPPRPVDSFILAEELIRSKELEAVGGVTYLSSLTDGLPRAINAKHYARIVSEKALGRRLARFHDSALRLVLDCRENYGELADQQAGELAAIARACALGRQAAAGAAGAIEDGAALLRDIENLISRFVVLPAGALLPVSLWTLATHCYQAFDAFPYVAVVSPTKRCGKTRLTEVLELVAARARRTVNISEAALFRLIEKTKPTLILDEAEALNGKTDRAEAIKALLNSGNRAGASVPRCVGKNFDIQEFSVYCPKIVAGIGGCPETIRDRSIVLSMQRRKATDFVERFLFRAARPQGEALRSRAAGWLARCCVEIERSYGELDLPFLGDREAEAWSPLFAVLAVADRTRVGELRRCGEQLTGSKAVEDEDDSLSLRLLSDIRACWPAGASVVLTADLLGRLVLIEESPWREEFPLNARKLGRMLRPFGVVSRSVRAGERSGKGYRLEAVEPAFARYLSPQRVT